MNRWTFRLPLPPGNNHMYHNNGRGGRVLTGEARQWRKDATAVAAANGFVASKKGHYSVLVWLTYPNYTWDIDGGVKAVLDAVVGSRLDHRVFALHVRKAVGPDTHCTIRILEW